MRTNSVVLELAELEGCRTCELGGRSVDGSAVGDWG